MDRTMSLILGIIKIIVGMGLMLLSVWWYTEWALRNSQDPYEWEKEMKAIFCDAPESNQNEKTTRALDDNDERNL